MIHHIVSSLSQSSLVDSFEILEFIDEESVQFIKINATLLNGSNLYIREYFSGGKSAYSYHWQNVDRELILRWDNAPYHRSVSTFPYHLHQDDKILPSFRVFIDDVLTEIQKHLMSASDLG